MELYGPYSKLKGMNGLFVTMKAMCLSVKKDVVFVEF